MSLLGSEEFPFTLCIKRGRKAHEGCMRSFQKTFGALKGELAPKIRRLELQYQGKQRLQQQYEDRHTSL